MVNDASRSLILTAPHTLEWQAEALPAQGMYDVQLKTLAGSISIGTELPQYGGIERTATALTYPRMTGYESYAQVVAIGDGVTRFAVGDHAFAFYGHRTRAQLHENRAYPVPAHLSPEIALSAILTCDVARGIRKLHPLPEARILITGGGAIGLLTLLVVRAYGVAHVDVVEPMPSRRKVAQSLGAQQVFAPDDAIPTDYDMAFECSSRQSAFALLQTHLKHHGKICILADGNLEPLILLPDFHHKELTIIGSSDGWDYDRHARWYFDYVAREQPPLQHIFDVHIQPEALPRTFAQLADGSLSAIKVLVDYR